MPGPDNIYVLTESIANGKRQGIIIALGLNSGVLVHTLAAATGISLILKQSAMAFQLVQYAGVAYLLYLAFQAYREKASYEEQETIVSKSGFELFRIGVTMNLLNPKVALFFIAFLPQFVQNDGWPVVWQMVLMGVSFMIIGFITFSSFALLADQLRTLLKSKGVMKKIKWAKILVLVALAVYLIVN